MKPAQFPTSQAGASSRAGLQLCQPAGVLTPLALRPPWKWGWFGHVVASWFVFIASALPDERTVRQDPVDWHIIVPQFNLGIILFSLAAALLLLLRRRYPLSVLAATTLLMVASALAGAFNGGVVVAVAIALYTCIQYLQRNQVVPIAVTITLVVAAVTLATIGWHTQQVLIVWVGAALGEAVRSQRAQLLEARARADRAEATREAIARQRVAETRLSIARDLHDVVAHQIAVINLHAGAAMGALPDRPDDARHSLAIVQNSAKAVIADIGALMTTLREPVPHNQAPDDFAGPTGLGGLPNMRDSLATHGFTFTTRTLGQPRELPGTIDSTAMRIIQEALTNAHKHGAEHRAHVVIEYLPDALRLSISNPVATTRADLRPATSPIPTMAVGTGHGIIGMKERAETVGGTLQSGPDGARGWQVTATLPLSPQTLGA